MVHVACNVAFELATETGVGFCSGVHFNCEFEANK